MSDLDQIVEKLEVNEQPATYGAVGGIVGIHHKVVMSGRYRTPRNSWVVNKATRLPPDYEPHEIHPALSQAVQEKPIIETPEDLDDWLAERAEQEWDDQIERDVKAGRLDVLVNQALEEYRERVGLLWSVRAGSGYRALAAEGPDGLVWFWIGSHDEDMMSTRGRSRIHDHPSPQAGWAPGLPASVTKEARFTGWAPGLVTSSTTT